MVDFSLGLWNAWIFLVPSVLSLPIFFHLVKIKGARRPPKVNYCTPMTIFCVFSKLIYFVALAYSFFLPLRLESVWFYVGVPIAVVGLIGSWVILLNWAQT